MIRRECMELGQTSAPVSLLSLLFNSLLIYWIVFSFCFVLGWVFYARNWTQDFMCARRVFLPLGSAPSQPPSLPVDWEPEDISHPTLQAAPSPYSPHWCLKKLPGLHTHSPWEESPGPSFSTFQGSSPCCSREISFGLVNGHPAWR